MQVSYNSFVSRWTDHRSCPCLSLPRPLSIVEASLQNDKSHMYVCRSLLSINWSFIPKIKFEFVRSPPWCRTWFEHILHIKFASSTNPDQLAHLGVGPRTLYAQTVLSTCSIANPAFATQPLYISTMFILYLLRVAACPETFVLKIHILDRTVSCSPLKTYLTVN